jgi:flagellar basal body-associated protein FliL
MSEETYEIADASEKKGSRTLWIILGIAAVIIICCCCVVILAAIIIGITSFTTDSYYYFNPLLSLA